MTADADELFEDAPCGFLVSRPDGTIVRVNRTFEQWTGHARDDLVGLRRLQDLLTGGGRIYHETHYAPLLQMQGAVREIALDFVRADGTRLPALVNSVLGRGEDGEPGLIRTTIFDATDRRAYEQELVRARERERTVALDLQRSLLAGELPQGGGLEIDVAYKPSVRGLEVGGDWYDAFELDAPGTLALVVGDVVGRGIDAAATMGQLRSAIRALAATGVGPAALIEALDRYARRHAVGQMSTVAYAQLDLGTHVLRYACAGHPPPAIVRPGVPAALLMDGRSTPLDAFGTAHPRAEGRTTLAPGSTVVLYTDGLIERRDRTLTHGMDSLLAELDRDAGRSAGLAEALARDLVDRDGPPDDVCVLTARMT